MGAIAVREIHRTIDTVPGIVWSTLPDGSVDFPNRRWLEYTGLSLEDAVGRGWETTVHPDDLAEFIARRISSNGSQVSAWAIPTNEELTIARHTWRLLGGPAVQ